MRRAMIMKRDDTYQHVLGRCLLVGAIIFSLLFASFPYMAGERYKMLGVVHMPAFDIMPDATKYGRGMNILAAAVMLYRNILNLVFRSHL